MFSLINYKSTSPQKKKRKVYYIGVAWKQCTEWSVIKSVSVGTYVDFGLIWFVSDLNLIYILIIDFEEKCDNAPKWKCYIIIH